MENNKYTKVFLQLVEKGNEAASLIAEADKKAIVYAELAKAIALSGLLNVEGAAAENVQETDSKEVVKEDKKESIKKGANKTKAKKKEEAKVAPVPTPEPEVAPEVAPEPEVTPISKEEVEAIEAGDEWTQELEEQFSEELGNLNWYVENWGEDYVYNECVPAFFEDAEVKGPEYVRPSNILAFTTYLYEISQS